MVVLKSRENLIFFIAGLMLLNRNNIIYMKKVMFIFDRYKANFKVNYHNFIAAQLEKNDKSKATGDAKVRNY